MRPSRARRHLLGPALSFSVLGLLSYLAVASVLGPSPAEQAPRLPLYHWVYLGPTLGDVGWIVASVQLDAGAGFRFLGGLLGLGGDFLGFTRPLLRALEVLRLEGGRLSEAVLGALSATRVTATGIWQQVARTEVQPFEVAWATTCLGAGALLSARLDLRLAGALPGVLLDWCFVRAVGAPGLSHWL